MAAAKKGKCLGRCGASSGHTTKLKQSIFFRYLWQKQRPGVVATTLLFFVIDKWAE
jgi:hypothetical protein